MGPREGWGHAAATIVCRSESQLGSQLSSRFETSPVGYAMLGCQMDATHGSPGDRFCPLQTT